MKTLNILTSWSALVAITCLSATATAQYCNTGACQSGGQYGFNDGNCNPRPSTPCPEVEPSTDCIGGIGPHGGRYLGPIHATTLGLHDHFSPQRFYPYSPAGLDATRMNRWNGQQASQYAWHGSFNSWRFGTPTAIVVPPTAAFQSEYNWGVAQTRSLPIYHQFGGAGNSVITAGGVGFLNTPYRPSSTSQFGNYPVRGPW